MIRVLWFQSLVALGIGFYMAVLVDHPMVQVCAMLSGALLGVAILHAARPPS